MRWYSLKTKTRKQKQKEYSEKYGEIPAYIEIDELKTKLRDTDYQATKYAEGWFTEEEYAPIKAQRQAWRDRINELEKQ